MFLLIFLCFLADSYGEITIQEQLPIMKRQSITGQFFQMQITQNQIARHYISPQSKISAQLPKECHIHPAYISVTPIIQLEVKTNENSQIYSFNQESKNLYQLNDKSLTLYATNLLQQKLQKVKVLNFDNECSKSMIEKWQEQKIYIFSCDKIYKISQNLSKLDDIKRKQENFSSFKVLRFQEFIFEVSANQGINIYKIDFKAQIQFLGNIKMYQNHTLHIADVFYSNHVLYVLDYKQGPFLYEHRGQFFYQKDKIQLTFKENVDFKFLLIDYNNLFIALSKVGESIVIQYALMSEKVFLVRYYKGYSSIQKISMFQNKLLIESESKIQLLPVNRDPRIIHQLNNGYTYTHDIKVRELDYLQDNVFLISSSGLLEIVEWRVRDSNIQCVFSDTGSYYVNYEKVCTKRQKWFWEVCVQKQQLQLIVLPSHKDDYFWLLLIVSGFFVLGIIFLIYWRNDQTQKINKIIRKIKEYKQKFQPKKAAIEFQEVEHAYSVDLKTQSDGFKETQDHKQRNEKEVNNQNESENYQQAGQSERRQLSHG